MRCTILWHKAPSAQFQLDGVTMTLVNNVIAGRDQRIADLAYRMWEEDGRPEGRAEAHWLRAAVLVDEMAPKAPVKKKAAAPKTPKKK